jgi:hypothetical protein
MILTNIIPLLVLVTGYLLYYDTISKYPVTNTSNIHYINYDQYYSTSIGYVPLYSHEIP